MRLGQLHESVTVEPLLSTGITKRNLQMYYIIRPNLVKTINLVRFLAVQILTP